MEGRHHCSLYLRVHWCTLFALASHEVSCFGLRQAATRVWGQPQLPAVVLEELRLELPPLLV